MIHRIVNLSLIESLLSFVCLPPFRDNVLTERGHISVAVLYRPRDTDEGIVQTLFIEPT